MLWGEAPVSFVTWVLVLRVPERLVHYCQVAGFFYNDFLPVRILSFGLACRLGWDAARQDEGVCQREAKPVSDVLNRRIASPITRSSGARHFDVFRTAVDDGNPMPDPLDQKRVIRRLHAGLPA